MVKKVVVVALLGMIILAGALAYSSLKPPAEASEPIQAIPIGREAIATPTPAPTLAGATAPDAVEGDPTAPMDEEPTAEAAPTAGSAAGIEVSEPIIFEIEQDESRARYVIDEVLRGTPATVVGSTNQVAGQIAVYPDGRSVQVGTILINARAFATDESRRDRTVQNQILLTNQYEYITFLPTAIEGLPASSSVGGTYTFRITGGLTIRDVTREVTFDVTVTPVSESRLEGSARTTIRYADWGVSIPQVPFVASVSDEVQLELDFVATVV